MPPPYSVLSRGPPPALVSNILLLTGLQSIRGSFPTYLLQLPNQSKDVPLNPASTRLCTSEVTMETWWILVQSLPKTFLLVQSSDSSQMLAPLVFQIMSSMAMYMTPVTVGSFMQKSKKGRMFQIIELKEQRRRREGEEDKGLHYQSNQTLYCRFVCIVIPLVRQSVCQVLSYVTDKI